MITRDQIKNLSQTFQIDEVSIFREYLQLIFLSYLYQEKGANKIFFKGGTALRLLFGSPRFSEDLDFSTDYSNLEITGLVKNIEKKMNRELPNLTIELWHRGKEGIRFRITFREENFKYPISIRLDFHQQRVMAETKISTLTTQFPMMIFPQVFYLSGKSILAEKFKALGSRMKGRDVFDIWFLLSRGINIGKIDKKAVKNIANFPQPLLEKDLGKFLPRSQKQIIPNLKDEAIKLLQSCRM